jgi:hypothetical protein
MVFSGPVVTGAMNAASYVAPGASMPHDDHGSDHGTDHGANHTPGEPAIIDEVALIDPSQGD